MIYQAKHYLRVKGESGRKPFRAPLVPTGARKQRPGEKRDDKWAATNEDHRAVIEAATTLCVFFRAIDRSRSIDP